MKRMVNEPEKVVANRQLHFSNALIQSQPFDYNQMTMWFFLYLFSYLVIISQKIIFQVLKKGRTGITADSFAFQGINKNAFSIENVVCAK